MPPIDIKRDNTRVPHKASSRSITAPKMHFRDNIKQVGRWEPNGELPGKIRGCVGAE